ncbi:uncharacterized protein A4U43_C06F14740 [Asparagus officinalis]|uniref:Uncharacterized protein n=1 Tax=Asparagus officinalis TaxID=4686 RepID=A0A5P1EMK2_ASPOF|nr:uncharacterized protein A4U43_C06F14740 [Asparagus officinalis]
MATPLEISFTTKKWWRNLTSTSLEQQSRLSSWNSINPTSLVEEEEVTVGDGDDGGRGREGGRESSWWLSEMEVERMVDDEVGGVGEKVRSELGGGG